MEVTDSSYSSPASVRIRSVVQRPYQLPIPRTRGSDRLRSVPSDFARSLISESSDGRSSARTFRAAGANRRRAGRGGRRLECPFEESSHDAFGASDVLDRSDVPLLFAKHLSDDRHTNRYDAVSLLNRRDDLLEATPLSFVQRCGSRGQASEAATNSSSTRKACRRVEKRSR